MGDRISGKRFRGAGQNQDATQEGSPQRQPSLEGLRFFSMF